MGGDQRIVVVAGRRTFFGKKWIGSTRCVTKNAGDGCIAIGNYAMRIHTVKVCDNDARSELLHVEWWRGFL